MSRRKKPEPTEFNPDQIYDRHTNRDDNRCLGCHTSSLNINEVYTYIKEKDFFDVIMDWKINEMLDM